MSRLFLPLILEFTGEAIVEYWHSAPYLPVQGTDNLIGRG